VPVAIMTIRVRQSFQKQKTSLKKWFLQLDLVPVIVFACRETGNGEEVFFSIPNGKRGIPLESVYNV